MMYDCYNCMGEFFFNNKPGLSTHIFKINHFLCDNIFDLIVTFPGADSQCI
jgi:hypothetical protein